MKCTDANNGPSMDEVGSKGVLDRTSERTMESIRSSSSLALLVVPSSFLLEREDGGDEAAFRRSALSSSSDVRRTVAPPVVGTNDDSTDESVEETDVDDRSMVVIAAREGEGERSRIDGGDADGGANDAATSRCRAAHTNDVANAKIVVP